jgi:ABC-type phosphate transport system substrate-binding protein
VSRSIPIKPLTVRAIGLSLALLGTVANADVVAIVSSKSTVPALNKDQASDIFLGKASRFPDGTQAVPIDQQEGSGTRDAFYAKVAGKTAAQIKAYWAKIIFTGRGKPPREVADGAEMKRFVVENPGVIGYIEDKFVDSSVRVVL